MTEGYTQFLETLHQQIVAARDAASGKDDAKLLELARQIDWVALAAEVEQVVGRYKSAIYRYGKRIIRNLRRPYLLYDDCVSLSLLRANLKGSLAESPSLRIRAEQDLADAHHWAVRREVLREDWMPAEIAQQTFPTLETLFAGIKAKLAQGRRLEATRSEYLNGRKVYGSVPRLFSWVVWCGDPEWLAQNGYGFAADEHLIFGGEIPNMPSHCVLWNRDGRMFSGFYTGDFRELSVEET